MVSGFGQFHTDEPDKDERARKPYAAITWGGVMSMVDNPQEVPKADAQWLIPSTLPSRAFKRQESEGQFWALWADLDRNPPPMQQVVDVLKEELIGGSDFEVYSSRGATADRPKARILIPLHQPLSGAEWVLAQQVLNDGLQQHGIVPDRTSERPAQLCYLPNRGEHYESASERGGSRFDPLQAWADQLARRCEAQVEAAAVVEADRKAAEGRRQAAAARPGGTGGRSLIEAFNAAYSVSDILIRASYAQRGDTFCHPASESGSYSASVKDGRVHSLSSSDPLYTGGGGQGAHDAFSAFCVLEHGGSRDAALRAAGDRMLTIGDESWNTVERREWAQRQQPGQTQPLPVRGDDAIEATRLFSVVPVHDLELVQPPAPAYWWDAYLPAGVVTLLGAHGGTGKSTMALMLAVCIVFGLPLFGIPTRAGRVAFFSGEDGPDLVRYRLRWVCEKMGVSAAELHDRLHILDATGGDPALFHEVGGGGKKQGLTTPSYAALRKYIDANDIDVLIVDNASDTYDASEIDRARVRGFMRALARLAQARAGAVLLLAHVDKGTSRGERADSEGYSGSTAWHNSARSRVYLRRDKDGALMLEHQKHNLGPMAKPLRLLWPDGDIPRLDKPVEAIVQRIADNGDTKALLKLIHEFTGRGEFVGTATTSRTHAGKLLRMAPGFPRNLPDARLFELLRDAERRGLLERLTFKGPDRKERERWQVTPAGAVAAGIRDFAATAATAATSGSGASGAEAAEPAATAATSPPGGVGEKARTEVAAEVAANDAGELAAQPSEAAA